MQPDFQPESILDRIRLTGVLVARENELINPMELTNAIPFESELVADFVDRLLEDLMEFSALEQFGDYYNLFARAFMYAYGRGAEQAFASQQGQSPERLSYDFDQAMRGVCGERLPDGVRFRLNQKASAMLTMYEQMFAHTRGAQEQLVQQGLSLGHCVWVMLNGACFYGRERCLAFPSADDEAGDWEEPANDRPYDPDTYDGRYRPADYRIVNITVN